MGWLEQCSEGREQDPQDLDIGWLIEENEAKLGQRNTDILAIGPEHPGYDRYRYGVVRGSKWMSQDV